MIKIYTTDTCPRCKVLKRKLDAKNIAYTEITDVEEMINLGLMTVPYLQVDGELMDFVGANDWINAQ